MRINDNAFWVLFWLIVLTWILGDNYIKYLEKVESNRQTLELRKLSDLDMKDSREYTKYYADKLEELRN